MKHPFFIGSLTLAVALPPSGATAQTAPAAPDSLHAQELGVSTVAVRRNGTTRAAGVFNAMKLHREELFRAACCNLGESFTTNPSVDVSYSDAATGAKQIKLLGLAGTYVQLLTENLPNLRGAAAPYALDYVPGPWIKSIQVSKGTASVKNGYEGITGQIDVEYLKPDEAAGATVNLYADTRSRFEANADASVPLSSKLSTEILTHYQNDGGHHDANGDGFLDLPRVRQYNVQNRWKWNNGRYLFHGGLGMLDERRTGGQIAHDAMTSAHPLFRTDVGARRYEAYMKHAWLRNAERGENIALMASAALHETDAAYGHKAYSVDEKSLYAQLLYETRLAPRHQLSVGGSVQHDFFGQHYRLLQQADAALTKADERETTAGAYAQYTFTLDRRFVFLAGLRVDRSSRYGAFLTPRWHIQYTPADFLTLRLSAGKGYRSAHALAEYHYLMASGRRLVIDDLPQEEAWNYGANAAFYLPLFGKTLLLNAEYYATRFRRQVVVDYDSDPAEIRLTGLAGRSYSHTFQVDATYPVLDGLSLTAAYRLQRVRTTYGGVLMEKPLTPRYKALLTASYKTPLGLWQFDATFQLSGGGRLPRAYTLADGSAAWERHFPSRGRLNVQVTRWFRRFSVYAGGENLTGARQQTLLYGADDPWGSRFEPTLVWGAVHGAMGYVGLRWNFLRN